MGTTEGVLDKNSWSGHMNSPTSHPWGKAKKEEKDDLVIKKKIVLAILPFSDLLFWL